MIVIILDDVGFAQLGCFGSDMATPNIDALAAGGLRYNRFHVTAMCSPTRASVLTGRNHHAVGMGFLADMPTAYPGYTCRLPKSVTPLPRVLRDAGYNTTAIGKWHLVPRGERSHSGPFDRWPLGYGFERFYGFLQGDTNQWTPNLVRDNHYVDPPRGHEDGYHLTEDLADAAIRHVLDQQQSAPGKPFYLSFATGAMHAPHHVRPSGSSPTAAASTAGGNDGAPIFARQVATGIVPEGTVLTERPSWVQAVGRPLRRRTPHAHAQEVFAGFLTHTDAQIGRLLDRLARDRRARQHDRDADLRQRRERRRRHARHRERAPLHVAAGRDRRRQPRAVRRVGRVPRVQPLRMGLGLGRQHAAAALEALHLARRHPRTVDRALARRHRRAGRDRSAASSATPSTSCRRSSTRAVSRQPEVVDGVTQQPFDGASLLPTFADAAAPSPRTTQYFELLGSRSIVHDGWKATTDHVSQGVVDEERLLEGSRDFATDRWQLFRLDDDFSEAHDVSAEHPDVVRALDARWNEEAERNHVFPLVDSLVTRVSAFIPPAYPPAPRSVFRPDASPATDESVPYLIGGFRITAVVDAAARPEGVLCALGDWNIGFAFFVVDGYLTFVVNAANDVSRVVADVRVPPGPDR